MPMQKDVRVLVVDDADELRKTYAEGLRLLGYEVAQASNGQQALEKVKRLHKTITAARNQLQSLERQFEGIARQINELKNLP